MLFKVFLIIYTSHFLYAEEECKRNFSVRKNSIILTKASQSKGANFIHKQVVNMFSECFSLCCSNVDCTVAVYENKVNHVCFMFNCKQPNVCLFTEHEDYISMLHIPNHETKTPNAPINQSVGRNKALNHPSMDAALGETCGIMRKCGPVNSMCTSGTCICQIGYIGKGDLCVRSLCPKPELMFQCLDVSKSPFCIALYDQCNGISECGDSSDELNCEPNQYRRPIFNETSNSDVTVTKTKPNVASHRKSNNRQSTFENRRNSYNEKKKHSIIQNQNVSSQNVLSNKKKYYENEKSRKKNPLAENQLLLLEAKNKPPKYVRHNTNDDGSKPRRQYAKPPAPAENSPLYEKHKYSKYKVSAYPRDYYQKSDSDAQDNSNRWNNMDSTASDYEYQQPSSNNRDSGSDWYPDQYSDSSYSDSPGRLPNERNNYIYYPDVDDDTYSKPRGPYISDSDRYRPKYPSSTGNEQSMDYASRRKHLQNKHQPIYVNIPDKPEEDNLHQSTIGSAKLKIDNDKGLKEASDRNMNEWSVAVIALSVGLLITAGLLIAIGFKMRTWRRRMRNGKKGKCLTTDEGDYLINGMYL